MTLLTTIRAAWKDWGFAPALFAQAKQFLALAQAGRSAAQEGYLRATIVFATMCFEAYFREVVRGYIDANKFTLDPQKVREVEEQMRSRVGMKMALRDWPPLLSGKALNGAVFTDYDEFREYRNRLVHGKVAEPLPSGKLAQELETIADAERVVAVTDAIVRATANHFGFPVPGWL